MFSWSFMFARHRAKSSLRCLTQASHSSLLRKAGSRTPFDGGGRQKVQETHNVPQSTRLGSGGGRTQRPPHRWGSALFVLRGGNLMGQILPRLLHSKPARVFRARLETTAEVPPFPHAWQEATVCCRSVLRSFPLTTRLQKLSAVTTFTGRVKSSGACGRPVFTGSANR